MSIGGYIRLNDDDVYVGRIWDATISADFEARHTPANSTLDAPYYQLWSKSPAGEEFVIGAMSYRLMPNRKPVFYLAFYLHGGKIEASAKEDDHSSDPKKMQIVPLIF